MPSGWLPRSLSEKGCNFALTWTTSAPAASTFSTSSPRRAKSAERIDGAMRKSRICTGATRLCDTAEPRAGAEKAVEKRDVAIIVLGWTASDKKNASEKVAKVSIFFGGSQTGSFHVLLEHERQRRCNDLGRPPRLHTCEMRKCDLDARRSATRALFPVGSRALLQQSRVQEGRI